MISVNCYYFCLKVLFFRLVLPFRSYACFPEDKTMYFIHLLLFTLSFENSHFFYQKVEKIFLLHAIKNCTGALCGMLHPYQVRQVNSTVLF